MEELGAYKAIKKKKRRGGGKKPKTYININWIWEGKEKVKKMKTCQHWQGGGFPGKSIPENMNLFSCVVSFFLHVLSN